MRVLRLLAVIGALALAAACSSSSAASGERPTTAARAAAPATTSSVATTAASTTTTVPGTIPPTTVAAPGARPAMTSEPSPLAGAPPGTVRYHFSYGPLDVKPGQNVIALSKTEVPRPPQDGFIIRMDPNLRRADGSVPPVDVIHLHHGVWLNLAAKDITQPAFPERFFAAGEEKTVSQLPNGYGYPFHTTDNWVINYMLHDLTPVGEALWITYDIDLVPASSPAAATITGARPVWMDVQNGSVYPVFDVAKGSGEGGTFTYPDDDPDAYTDGKAKNTWTVDRDGVLLATAGHLHPGGLHDDLNLQRGDQQAHLFRSDADYFEPAGAVSWDVAMTATPADWRVAVHSGDVLSVHATYDSARASWYESMGIMVVWMADGTDGPDPFATPVDKPGAITHGHLPENDNHGGAPTSLADPATRATAPAPAQVDIDRFGYGDGDLTSGGPLPVIQRGQSLRFVNDDAPIGPGIWHTLTACKAPCTASTGIAYPLADADVAFDSGQLGTAGPPTAGRDDWSVPNDLADGTYTYFCRIHPFMRGAFVVQG